MTRCIKIAIFWHQLHVTMRDVNLYLDRADRAASKVDHPTASSRRQAIHQELEVRKVEAGCATQVRYQAAGGRHHDVCNSQGLAAPKP